MAWILCSQRRLSADEFLAAISVDFEGNAIKICREDVLNICHNLVILDPELNVFRFAHLSVREFLEERPEYTITVTHSLAAERCLTVCLDITTSPVATAANNSFRAYSTLFWALHCQMSGEGRLEDKISHLVHKFVGTTSNQSLSYSKWNQLAMAALPRFDWQDNDIQKRIRSMTRSPTRSYFCCMCLGVFRDYARFDRA